MERIHIAGDKRHNDSYVTNKNNNNATGRQEITGLTRITKKRLKELCKKDKLYQTPALNDVLYLHYQGIDGIGCLEEYTGLKCLWLECNAITEIQGLENQKQLKCLFLQSNLIKRIENLENCPELDTLNLASNHIRKIENCGIDVLPVLSTLNLSANYLKDFDGLKDLENCKTLSVLDLSNNRIDDILVVKIFAKMPNLRVLVLQGNPVVSKLPQYRKTLILECKELTYLDSRPVFPKDRACAEAWKAGGYEGERKENERWNRRERRKIRDSVNATILMRNKYKPPDQQDKLFNSSDSEEDATIEKRQRQAAVDAGINMELGIWEEVVNVDNTKSETTSSDMNVSSSESGLSTTDSNGNNTSADSNSMELKENMDKDEKIANNSSDMKSDVLNIAHDYNMGEILKVVHIRGGEVKENQSKDRLVAQKRRVLIEELADEEASVVVERLLDTEIIPTVLERVDQCDSRPTALDLSDLDDGARDEYNATANAICKITSNDLSTTSPSPKKRIKLQIELDESLEIEDGYDFFETIIDTKGETIEKNLVEASESFDVKIKTVEEIKYEQECEEVNQKVAENLEDLSTHMDEFLEEMQINNFEWNKKNKAAEDDAMKKQDDDVESGGSKDAESQWEETNLQVYPAAIEIEIEKIEHLEGEKDTDNKAEKEASSSSSFSDAPPPEANTIEKIESIDTIRSNEQLSSDDVTGAHANEPTPAVENSRNTVEEVESVIGKDKTRSTLDIQWAPPDAYTNFKREERELRHLLQKLENENEQLYQINKSLRRVLEQDIREEIKYRDKESDENTEKICEDIVEELLETLNLPLHKPKSYEFGVIESDDEYSYSTDPQPQEELKPTHSLHDLLSSFNQFVQEIARKNREEEECKEREGTEALRRKHATTEAEKVASLHNLLNSPHLRDFNGDTKELLEQKIAAEKKRESERVKKLVERVYAQKDKYNDTLDVVGGKLVVVKQETGEIEELPESKVTYSESEDSDEFESANSDNEASAKATHLWNAKIRRAENNDSFKLPYRPTERLSALKLIQQTNECREQEDAKREAVEKGEAEEDDDESNEKFYSLEPTKPDNFRDIDEEFIEKLNLEEIAVALEKDVEETEEVQCARSYTELKQIVKENKDLNLTDDENAMLQKMLGRAEKEDRDKTSADPLTAEENELLHKMVERTKQRQGKEKEISPQISEMAIKPTLSKETIKIIEFGNGKNKVSGGKAGESTMNIKQLNTEFSMPRAFRDMLEDCDLDKTELNVSTSETEMTLLYMKENYKRNEAGNNETKLSVARGNFDNPLQLSRGGIVMKAHEGGRDELNEFETNYKAEQSKKNENELKPETKKENFGADEIVKEVSAVKGAAAIQEDSVVKEGDNIPKNCERLRDVAASLLNFHGSHYEEYGIDKETAHGVVEYEKMLNFGYEDEQEFDDAPMEEEELVKIIKEALQNDQAEAKAKERQEEKETYKEMESNEDDHISKQAEESLGVDVITFEVPKELEKESTQEEFCKSKSAESEEYIATPAEADRGNYKAFAFKEFTEEKASEEEHTGKLTQSAGRKTLLTKTEFQEQTEEYKDFPSAENNFAETTVSADRHIEPQTEARNQTDVEMGTNFLSSTTAPIASELSHKSICNVVEKRQNFQQLLKAPILKQFNDDTSESLDAQIHAAKQEDYDVIECSLQVIDDGDEVVKEISVEARINYIN